MVEVFKKYMDSFLSIVASISLFISGTTTPVQVVEASTTLKMAPVERVQVVKEIEKVFPEDKRLMVKVASCESGLDPDAKSSSSSASGIFQVIKGTWKHFDCKGDPFNYKHNISCARKIYDSAGGLGHWSESFHCWKKTN